MPRDFDLYLLDIRRCGRDGEVKYPAARPRAFRRDSLQRRETHRSTGHGHSRDANYRQSMRDHKRRWQFYEWVWCDNDLRYRLLGEHRPERESGLHQLAQLYENRI